MASLQRLRVFVNPYSFLSSLFIYMDVCPVKGFHLIKCGFDSVKHLPRVQIEGFYCIIN